MNEIIAYVLDASFFNKTDEYGDAITMANAVLPFMKALNVTAYFCADEHNLQYHNIEFITPDNKIEYILPQFIIGGGGARLDYKIYKAFKTSDNWNNIKIGNCSLNVDSKFAVNIHGFSNIILKPTGELYVRLYTENGGNFAIYKFSKNKLIKEVFSTEPFNHVCEFKNVHEIEYLIGKQSRIDKIMKLFANQYINGIELIK
jgi:hypothetical protein